jgi:hypothetical protein
MLHAYISEFDLRCLSSACDTLLRDSLTNMLQRSNEGGLTEVHVNKYPKWLPLSGSVAAQGGR